MNQTSSKSYLSIVLTIFCLVVLSLSTTSTFSQDQKEADSLKTIFRKNDYDRAKRLSILADIAYNETNFDEKIIYSQELIASAKDLDTIGPLINGYMILGQAYQEKGDLTEALKYILESSKLADRTDEKFQARTKIALADIYSEMGDVKLAIRNYKNGLKFFSEKKDTINIAITQNNLGDLYYNENKLDSALVNYKNAAKGFALLGLDNYQAYVLGGEGLIYAKLDDEVLAEQSLNGAIRILELYEDYGPITDFLVGMSDVYVSRSNRKKALQYAQRSLDLAEKFGYKQQISDANQRIASINKSLKNYKKALEAFENHITYRDSINNVNTAREREQLRTKREIDQKELEKRELEQQKKTQTILNIGIGIVLILIGFLAYFLYKRNKFVVETSKIIEQEKERSENLLLNILPDETAKELKENGSVEAKRFDNVSVLFTDFKGFTKFSEKLSPEELVKTIDYYFSKFDEIMEKYGIEKIKTVGDAYMCASGLPFPAKNHAYKLVKAAFDIIDFVNEAMSENAEASFDIRVGINSGSVVAGVVGTKKFAYDIWGDTVNTASRMESSGEVGRVNISESTYNLLKNNRAFEFVERGSIEAKGKGKIKMYFVRRRT